MVKNSSRPNEPREMECDVVGKRRFSVWDHIFEVDQKYCLVKCIGKGAYGVVCSAIDESTSTKVAIKKISKPLNNKTNALRCLREMKLLRHLQHPNIVQIKGVMKPATHNAELNGIYITYECMDTDLHQIIRSKQPLSDDHHKFFILQTLKGLKYLHSANVMHRDLKPSNLLVNGDCSLRIADFGLARARSVGEELTRYVVTRWYRAPEVMMFQPYSFCADLWSVGCILGELLLGAPLFPGSGGLQTLKKMIELIGRPSNEDIQNFHPNVRSLIGTIPDNGNRIDEEFSKTNELCRDLLKSLLQFIPEKRPTAEEALSHPWFDDMRVEEEETIAEKDFAYDFDDNTMDIEDIHGLMIKEIEIWNDNSNNSNTDALE